MDVISLDKAREGSVVVVVNIGECGWARRLYYLGVLPGSKLEIVVNKGRGPIVVRLSGTEISIGRGIAKRILVKVEHG